MQTEHGAAAAKLVIAAAEHHSRNAHFGQRRGTHNAGLYRYESVEAAVAMRYCITVVDSQDGGLKRSYIATAIQEIIDRLHLRVPGSL
jgi:hypothetical protein